MAAIFETKCTELNIDFTIETVDKTDPKTKDVIWSNDVAMPDTSAGFVELMGEDRVHSFLVDKTKIWLRSQNDPRKAVTKIDPDTYAKNQGFANMSELIEAAKAYKLSKADDNLSQG